MPSHHAKKILAAFCGACLALACSGSTSIGENSSDGGGNSVGANGEGGGTSNGDSAITRGGTSNSSGANGSGAGSSNGANGSTGSTGSSGGKGSGSTGSTGSSGGNGSGSTGGDAGSSGTSGSSSGSNVPVDGGSGSGHCTSTRCPASQLCVQSQVVGGAVVFADAGACPAGMELAANGRCVNIPTYTCVNWPAACGGAVSCPCASALCPPGGFMCDSSATMFLSCVQAVP
jgi:hypothetical protein